MLRLIYILFPLSLLFFSQKSIFFKLNYLFFITWTQKLIILLVIWDQSGITEGSIQTDMSDKTVTAQLSPKLTFCIKEEWLCQNHLTKWLRWLQLSNKEIFFSSQASSCLKRIYCVFSNIKISFKQGPTSEKEHNGTDYQNRFWSHFVSFEGFCYSLHCFQKSKVIWWLILQDKIKLQTYSCWSWLLPLTDCDLAFFPRISLEMWNEHG